MPSSIFWGMQHLNQDLLCSIGFETTGADPMRHELVEVCVLPLDHMLKPHADLILFNMKMKIEMPEEVDWKECRLSRKEIAELTESGIARDTVAEFFLKWFEDMKMPFRKKIVILGHDAAYMRAVLLNWLGEDIFKTVFADDYRDTKVAAHFINDMYDVRGSLLPYSKQTLSWLAKKLNIEKIERGGGACSDANTTMEVYRGLLRNFLY